MLASASGSSRVVYLTPTRSAEQKSSAHRYNARARTLTIETSRNSIIFARNISLGVRLPILTELPGAKIDMSREHRDALASRP